jgi:hypothetical protein
VVLESELWQVAKKARRSEQVAQGFTPSIAKQPDDISKDAHGRSVRLPVVPHLVRELAAQWAENARRQLAPAREQQAHIFTIEKRVVPDGINNCFKFSIQQNSFELNGGN